MGELCGAVDATGASGADPEKGPNAAMPSTAPHSPFDVALAFVLRMEGVDSDHPSDPGGRTRFGISQRAYPDLDIPNLTLEQAAAIYRRDYWQAAHCDQLPPSYALALFDAAVNLGKPRAVSILQAALGVQIDGVVGSKTVAAASRQYRSGLARFLSRRAVYYMELSQVSPARRVFLAGWMNRCFECHAAALGLEG